MAQLTDAQLVTLQADITGNANQVIIDALAADDVVAIRDWYNGEATPTYYVWGLPMTLEEVGSHINAEDLGNITTGNATRLDTFFTVMPGGVDPIKADVRAFFDDVFSGANGAQTRANLEAVWSVHATEFEKVFATGTGTQVSPATRTVNGEVTIGNVRDALNS